MLLRFRSALARGLTAAGGLAPSDLGTSSQLPVTSPSAAGLRCPWCAQPHTTVRLRRRQRATCVRCGTVLATRSSGGQATLAHAVTGLLLTPPALLLPFVTVDKLGAERVTRVFTGVPELWDQGMHWLGVWVIVCGSLAPVALLGSLVILFAVKGGQRPWAGERWLRRGTRAVEKWAMPEVYVLAVLVAFTKLGTVVNVKLGPGFWCYAAMTLSFLLAWRSFELDPARAFGEVDESRAGPSS